MSTESIVSASRPVVFDYRSQAEFFRAMMAYQKSRDPKFSVRQRVKEHRACSPSLVTQVLNAKRRLTRDQLPIFGRIFGLTAAEITYLDERLVLDRWPAKKENISRRIRNDGPRTPKNHLLDDWLNAYVKDAGQLRAFRPDPTVVHALLGGIASVAKISRSMNFLFREGFWRRDLKGRVVLNEAAVFSSDGITHGKIRQFHKRALKVALRGLDIFPVERRRAATVLVSVNKNSAEELRTLVHKFQNELFEFIENHPDGNEALYQVAIHLTPIGGGKC